jgi:hypothetical protein
MKDWGDARAAAVPACCGGERESGAKAAIADDGDGSGLLLGEPLLPVLCF